MNLNYNEIAETFKSIKVRPALYIGKYPDFDAAASFIDGYLTAWAYRYNSEQKNKGHSLWRDIQEWYCDKSNIKNKQSLQDMIKERYTDLNEEELIQKYLNILIEFFKFKHDEKYN